MSNIVNMVKCCKSVNHKAGISTKILAFKLERQAFVGSLNVSITGNSRKVKVPRKVSPL